MTETTSQIQFDVQLATPDYQSDFLLMLRAYMTELRAQGCEILPTERTLDYWSGVFDILSTKRPDAGAAVIATVPAHGDWSMGAWSVGFSLASIVDLPFDTDFGVTAMGHGTYVLPSHRGVGVGTAMRKALCDRLREIGVHTLLGGLHLNNLAGAASLKNTGFQLHQMLGYVRL